MSNERKFRLQVTEGELVALLHHHSLIIQRDIETESQPSLESSERLHDLMKRLHKTTPEIEEVVTNAAPAPTPVKSEWD